MVVEVNVEVKDWEKEYLAERIPGDSAWFSDAVKEGQLSFKAEVKFLDDGLKTKNKYGNDIVRFQVEHDGKKKTWDVGSKQFDLLKTIAKAKPLAGKIAELERVGSTPADTRRTLKFK